MKKFLIIAFIIIVIVLLLLWRRKIKCENGCTPWFLLPCSSQWLAGVKSSPCSFWTGKPIVKPQIYPDGKVCSTSDNKPGIYKSGICVADELPSSYKIKTTNPLGTVIYMLDTNGNFVISGAQSIAVNTSFDVISNDARGYYQTSMGWISPQDAVVII